MTHSIKIVTMESAVQDADESSPNLGITEFGNSDRTERIMIFLARILLVVVSALVAGEVFYGYQLAGRLHNIPVEPITVGTEIQKAMTQPGSLSSVIDTVLNTPITAPTPADRMPPPLPPRPKAARHDGTEPIAKNADNSAPASTSTATSATSIAAAATTATVVPPAPEPPKSAVVSEQPKAVTAPDQPKSVPTPSQPRPNPDDMPEKPKTTEVAALLPMPNVPSPFAGNPKPVVVRQPEPFVRPTLGPVSTPKEAVTQASTVLAEFGATIEPAKDAAGKPLPNRFEVTIDPNPNGGITRLNPRQQRNLAQALADMGDTLYALNLRHTGIGNLNNLGTMPGLVRLDLTGSDFLNINPLTRWPVLEVLNVAETHVDNMLLVSEMTNLRVLNLTNTNNFDVTLISTLVGLEELHLSGTRVGSIAAVASMPRLKVLDLSGTPVAELGALKEASQLQRLSVARTGVSELKSLSGCASLVGLDLSQCENLKKLNGLESLSRLETLSLFQIPAEDLTPLSGCSSLKTLEISRSGVKTFDGLKPLPVLENLYARGLNLQNATALLQLGQLKFVDLTSTTISGTPAIDEIVKKLEEKGVRIKK